MFSKRLLTFWLLSLAVAGLSGCNLDLGQHWDDEDETYFVDYYRQPCDSSGTGLCFRLRTDDSSRYQLSKVAFSGFQTYEWGNRYRVTVTTSRNDNGERTAFRLQQIEEVTPYSGEGFELTLHTASGILQQDSQSRWWLAGDTLLDCASDCSELANAVQQGEALVLALSIGTGALQVDEVVCRAAPDNLEAACDTDQEVAWQVAEFMSECGRTEARLCLLYRTSTSAAFERLPLTEGISGFSWQWGSRYDLDVTASFTRAGALSAARYDATRATDSTLTGNSYRQRLILRGDALARDSGGVVALYGNAASDSTGLSCGTLCSRLNGYIEDDEYLLLQTYADGNGHLQLTEISCHNADLAAFRSCVAGYPDVNWPL